MTIAEHVLHIQVCLTILLGVIVVIGAIYTVAVYIFGRRNEEDDD